MHAQMTHQLSLWSKLLRSAILPVGDRLFGQKMMRRLDYLEEAQWWDQDRIQSEKYQRLTELISVAYSEIPLYRESMDQLGIAPGDICVDEDLRLLPVFTKELLRANYPDRTTRRTGQKSYPSCTSGSTGKNFCVLEDAETAGWYRASLLLALGWSGWKIGEPHLQTGMTTTRSIDRWLKDFILRCHYVSAYELSNEKLQQTLEIIERSKIQYVWGYPGGLFLLAKYAISHQWNLPLQSVVTWGDTLYPHYRKKIEAAFQTQVFDTYGCAEGMHIAAQCEQMNYHIHELDIIVELVDDLGVPVQPGEVGNVIVTRLHPGPMPLIRYQIGDLAVALDGKCSCGRGLRMLRSIQGRDTDIVITPSGNRLIVHFFTGILEHFAEIDSFQVVQEELRSIQLYISPNPSYTSITSPKIISALQEKGAQDLEIDIHIVDRLKMPGSGKHRFVISKLPESGDTST
jgi:phenylacetate-CoA ligase